MGVRIGFRMLTLLEHIEKRLSTHKSCTVFESLLEAAFPFEKLFKEKRAEAIHAFAKANGLVAKIHDPGIRVTFRRAPENDEGSRRRKGGRAAESTSKSGGGVLSLVPNLLSPK